MLISMFTISAGQGRGGVKLSLQTSGPTPLSCILFNLYVNCILGNRICKRKGKFDIVAAVWLLMA